MRDARRWDEVWDGVLHAPLLRVGDHQHFGTRLLVSLLPVAERLELRMAHETGLFRPGRADDYRVPDLIVAPPSSWTRRGVEGPSSFVVEILSEDDESYDKLPFYAELQVAELFLVDPTDRTFELYVLRAGVLRLVQADDAGVVRSASLRPRGALAAASSSPLACGRLRTLAAKNAGDHCDGEP